MTKAFLINTRLSITYIRRSFWKPSFDAPLSVDEVHANGIFGHQVLGEVLGAIGGAVLPAGAAETDLQVSETTLEEALHVRIDQRINVVEEAYNLAVLLKKSNYRLIKPCQLLEPLIFPRIMH